MAARLPVADVRRGMFVHSIDCSWLDNAFWHGHFPIDRDLLRDGGIANVAIDESRGVARAPVGPAGGGDR